LRNISSITPEALWEGCVLIWGLIVA